MKYRVEIAEHAATDLLDCYDWISSSDGVERAFKVLMDVSKVIESLSTLPLRGARLSAFGNVSSFEYRQVIKHGFRIIYRIDENVVTVAAVIHERRELLSTLQSRHTARS